MNADKKQSNEGEVEAVVVEAMPNALFRVEVDGEEEIAYLSGKMRLHRIKVLLGDRVLIKKDPYGGRSRIIRRF